MTLNQIKAIRSISNKGITSKEIKHRLAEYANQNNVDPKEVVEVCSESFSVDRLLEIVDK